MKSAFTHWANLEAARDDSDEEPFRSHLIKIQHILSSAEIGHQMVFDNPEILSKN